MMVANAANRERNATRLGPKATPAPGAEGE